MKKTTAYARKQRLNGGTYNGAQWLNTIQRCRTYAPTGDLTGSWVEGTESAATKAEMLVRGAADDLLKHRRPLDCERAFDILSNAMGVSIIRSLQIQPDESKNPFIEILKAGTEAVRRSINRYNATGAWGIDGPGRIELANAVDVYAEILRNSSPAQMEKATLERMKIINKVRGAAN